MALANGAEWTQVVLGGDERSGYKVRWMPSERRSCPFTRKVLQVALNRKFRAPKLGHIDLWLYHKFENSARANQFW